MARRFNPPPNWPTAPEGWEPHDGWMPPADWGPAPTGWAFWVEDERSPSPTAAPPSPAHDLEASLPGPPHEGKIRLFGARGQAKELSMEVAHLRGELSKLRAEMRRLGTLEVVELEVLGADLGGEIEVQRRRLAAELAGHAAELEAQTKASQRRREDLLETHKAEVGRLEVRLKELRVQVVVTEESMILQEVGVYQYRHPLTDAAAYKDRLSRLQDRISAAARSGDAVTAAQEWTVNGSAAQGRTMLNDYSKLMLRAYNAEADNLVRGLKPYKLVTSIQRLEKVAHTIERLGKTMAIRVSPVYHQLRVEELELTADYMEKVAVEKEHAREERERLREEAKVQQEIARERQRLEKERQHYINALRALQASGDAAGADHLRAQLGDVDKAIADVDYRAANIRAGYVYVISNVGAFGERMVKIGLTRRLEPMDRVRELGDASVPFRFDVHALFFSKDAVGIEAAMHARLADRRVNRVNMRREFFYATPAEARDHLLELAGELLQFEELPEALEYHQSVGVGAAPSAPAPPPGDLAGESAQSLPP